MVIHMKNKILVKILAISPLLIINPSHAETTVSQNIKLTTGVGGAVTNVTFDATKNGAVSGTNTVSSGATSKSGTGISGSGGGSSDNRAANNGGGGGGKDGGLGSSGAGGGKLDGNPMFDFQTSYNPVTRTITVKDLFNGAQLVSDVGAKKVYDETGDFKAGDIPIEPKSIVVTPVHNGYDVTLQFENTGTAARRIGAMIVSNLPFDRTAYFRDFSYLQRGDSEYAAVLNSDNQWNYFGRIYPGAAYSPVMVMRGNMALPNGKSAEYAVGVSLQYPLLDYRHNVFIRTRATNDRKWGIEFVPNAKWATTTGPCTNIDPPCEGRLSDYYNPALDLPPYDAANPNANKRSYTYSVRFMRTPSKQSVVPAAWLRLLDPYRQFFQKTYGAPRYEADRRPVQGVMMAISSKINAQTNPFGFYEERPDINGWQPVVNALTRLKDQNGWPRQLLWLPSGMSTNLFKNFPYEFTSHWNDIPTMKNSQDLIAQYGKSTGTLGLWWGRSTEVMFGDWASSHHELFDQRNLAHRERAFEELEGARAVNARMIGLDQYILKGADGYSWLQEMRMRYPEMTFIGESFQSDVIHLLAPNFKLVGINPEATDRTQCTDGRPLIRPLALPEFLLPGNETWGFSWITWVNENYCGSDPTWKQNTPALAYWPQYVASQGYTPVLQMSGGALQTIDMAAVLNSSKPGYKTIVPADLQAPYFPVITKQPQSVHASCGGTVKLTAEAKSPRGKSLGYTWYFRPYSTNPAHDALPANPAVGMMSPVADGGKYAGGMTPELTVHVEHDTVGTYQLVVGETDGGPTRSQFVAVGGDCVNANF